MNKIKESREINVSSTYIQTTQTTRSNKSSVFMGIARKKINLVVLHLPSMLNFSNGAYRRFTLRKELLDFAFGFTKPTHSTPIFLQDREIFL